MLDIVRKRRVPLCLCLPRFWVMFAVFQTSSRRHHRCGRTHRCSTKKKKTVPTAPRHNNALRNTAGRLPPLNLLAETTANEATPIGGVASRTLSTATNERPGVRKDVTMLFPAECQPSHSGLPNTNTRAERQNQPNNPWAPLDRTRRGWPVLFLAAEKLVSLDWDCS
jgi:hypothetical protein